MADAVNIGGLGGGGGAVTVGGKAPGWGCGCMAILFVILVFGSFILILGAVLRDAGHLS